MGIRQVRVLAAISLLWCWKTVPAQEVPLPFENKSLKELDVALRSPDWRERASAALGIALLREQAIPAIQKLAKLTSDRDWPVRLAALEALSELQPQVKVEVLIPLFRKALEDEAWTVRVAAVEGLGMLGPAAKGSEAGLQNLKHDIVQVGDLASWALKRMAPSAEVSLKLSAEKMAEDLAKKLEQEATVQVLEEAFILARHKSVNDVKYREFSSILRSFIAVRRKDLFQGMQFEGPVKVLFAFGATSLRSLAKSCGLTMAESAFGQYLAKEKALLVDLERGPGNVTHEVVHLLVHGDFKFDGRWFLDGVGVPSWMDEGLGGVFEGRISGYIKAETQRESEKVVIHDMRHYNFLAALKKQARWEGNGTNHVTQFPDPLPPLTLDWLIRLPNSKFYESYHAICSLSMAMARELMLYLAVNGKLWGFYQAYKDRMKTLQTRPFRAYLSARIAQECLEQAFGKNLKAIEAEFIAWTTTRTEICISLLDPLP